MGVRRELSDATKSIIKTSEQVQTQLNTIVKYMTVITITVILISILGAIAIIQEI